jgi:hypothetical protein
MEIVLFSGTQIKCEYSCHVMKRQLIALIVMLAVGLQGSLVAFAGLSPLMSTDCRRRHLALGPVPRLMLSERSALNELLP